MKICFEFDEKAWLEEKGISYSIMIEDLGP